MKTDMHMRTLSRFLASTVPQPAAALARVVLAAIALLGPSGLLLAAEPPPTPRQFDGLTLERALALAEQLQPRLAEAGAHIDAAAGRAQNAGAFPNPEAILGAQQLPLNGPDEREYIAGIGQSVPVGGRLAKARRAELLDRDARLRELDVIRRDVRKRVHAAFATALFQDHAHQTRRAIAQHAEKAVATTRARLDAGDALPDDLARVEMELALEKVELRRAESLRQQSLLALASAIGDPTLNVQSLDGALDATLDIPALENLAAALDAQPETAHARADLRARLARVDAVRAERIPDIKVELLYHRLEATRSDTIDLGLTIPLPLFNRNQGRLRAARAEAAAAEARARITANELETTLRDAHQQLLAQLATRNVYKQDLLPRAQTLLNTAEARYAAGDLSLADLLPLRRQWAALQLNHLESLRDVMRAWAELSPFISRQ